MTREEAKREIMQIYGSLSSQKQIALDTLMEEQEPSRKGHWIKKEDEIFDTCWRYVCSECEQESLKNRWNDDVLSRFCPNCGAEMI